MTDVRLTATTTDGEVVPVLSNTKGELLLEAPIAPPEFDGDLDGNLTVSGDANFSAKVRTVGDQSYYHVDRTNASGSAALYLGFADGVEKFKVGIDGSGNFDGTLTTQKNIAAVGNASVEGNVAAGYGRPSSGCNLGANGTASFAGSKAGVTAEGELFFTSRGVRYKLTVSGDLVYPEPYTREEQVKEKLER